MKKPNKTTKPQSFLNKRQKLAKATAWMTTTRRERGGEIKKNWFPYARWLPMIIEMYRTLLYVLYVVRYPRRQWKFVWLCFVALPFSRLLGRSLLFIKRQQWLLLVLLLSILASEFVFIFLPLTLSRSLRNTFFCLHCIRSVRKIHKDSSIALAWYHQASFSRAAFFSPFAIRLIHLRVPASPSPPLSHLWNRSKICWVNFTIFPSHSLLYCSHCWNIYSAHRCVLPCVDGVLCLSASIFFFALCVFLYICLHRSRVSKSFYLLQKPLSQLWPGDCLNRWLRSLF